MGWKIYRIWSTDWIKDPRTEEEHLINAIEYAIANYREEKLYESTEETTENFVTLEEKVVGIDDENNPYDFAKEKDVSFDHLPRSNGYLSGSDCVLEIINSLYPVHYDIICQHMAPLYGNIKATVKIRREVDYCIKQLEKRVVKKDDFYYPAGYKEVIPRVNSRKIIHISIDELAEAMYVVLSKSVGLTKEQLCSECARAYNFQRMTANIEAAMNKAFDILMSQKRIEIIEEKVKLTK